MIDKQKLIEALLKIYEPETYHHWETDPYTRAACGQQVAMEVLQGIGVLDDKGILKHPIQDY